MTWLELVDCLGAQLGVPREQESEFHRKAIDQIDFEFAANLRLLNGGPRRWGVGCVARDLYVEVNGGDIGGVPQCWGAQVFCFVKVTVAHGRLAMPPELASSCNHGAIDFAVVRWLAPHPDANGQDVHGRPVCAGFASNHALWACAVGAVRTLPQRAIAAQLARQGSDYARWFAKFSRSKMDLVPVHSTHHVMNIAEDADTAGGLLEILSMHGMQSTRNANA